MKELELPKAVYALINDSGVVYKLFFKLNDAIEEKNISLELVPFVNYYITVFKIK